MTSKKDAFAAALTLLAAAGDANTAKERLEALEAKRLEVETAIKQQQTQQAGIDASQKALEAMMADHKRHEEDLRHREELLDEAQKEFAAKCEGERRAINQARQEHSKFVAAKAEDLKHQQDLLTDQARVIAKDKADLDKAEARLRDKNDALIKRETVLNQQIKEHEDRKRRVEQAWN